jgi:RNA polymerase sigma-32 factor
MAHSNRDQADETSLRTRAASVPLLDADTERELLRRIRDDDDRGALDALLASHLRLVVSVASRFARSGLSMRELVSEGNLGLLDAVRRFDPAKNARYATYASWWVRSYVSRYALANRRIVPGASTRHARKLYAAMRTVERRIEQDTGEHATREAIAALTGTTIEDVELVQIALSMVDTSLGSQEEDGYEPLSSVPSPEDAVAGRQDEMARRARVRAALALLDARERAVIDQRIMGDEEKTLATIGIELGISRERVRQIEVSAKRKLRTALESAAA